MIAYFLHDMTGAHGNHAFFSSPPTSLPLFPTLTALSFFHLLSPYQEPAALAVAAPPVAEVPPGPAQDITPEPPLLFPADAQLQDLTGALVNANEALANRSVGLYFGAGWCSMTRAANPGVAAFLRPRESEGVTLGKKRRGLPVSACYSLRHGREFPCVTWRVGEDGMAYPLSD